MKHLTILVPEGQNNLSSIVGTFKIFTRAEEYWQSGGNKPMFQIQLAGTSPEVELHNGLFAVRPHTTISAIRQTHLVIIPALHHDCASVVEQNRVVADWILEQYKGGAAAASLCTGGFLLASTGLLNGRTCSTHWRMADIFQKMYPKVNVVADRIITDEHGLYTSGGAFSFLNLVLYLIEKYYDRTTAIYCSKIFEIDIDRVSQSPFAIFSVQKEHGDDAIRDAQLFIESHSDDRLSMEDLAARFAIGRRNFDRRFKKATGNSPAEYWQRARIEKAKKGLETTRKNVNEVMYEAGYADVKAFRNIFRKITGLSPLEYRNKFNKERTKGF